MTPTNSSQPLAAPGISLPPPRVNEMPFPPTLRSPPTSTAFAGPTPPSAPSLHSVSPASSLPPGVDTNNPAIAHKPVLPPIPSSRGTASPFSDHAKPPASMSHATSSPPPPPPSTANAAGASQSQTSQQPAGASAYRPLNVRDALTYLDQVKVQFADQPDVYNRFLDIMKDFKSQTIDTPGVIERVSTLFKGHPGLISGFNTFLPPGYRIECSTDPHEPDLIRVTTPSGTTTTTAGGGRYKLEPENSMHPSSMSQSYYHQPYGHMRPPPPGPPMPPPPLSSAAGRHPMHTSAPPSPPMAQAPYMPVSGPSRPQMLPPQHAPPPMARARSPPPNEKRGPVEFNHAINYVNKIKNRFANEPDTYKQFLEILQTYQKEQRPIQEVYAHVQYLFNGAPDLLDEFKQFLPDITGQPASALFDTSSSPYYVGHKRGVLGGSPQTASMVPAAKKKRTTGIDRLATGKRSKLYHKGGEMDQSSMREAYAYPSSPFDPERPSVSVEEVELFERVRKHIGNKPSYEEFLKTLNLYTQQIISMDTLIDLLTVFLGNNKELFDWFKNVIGYEPSERIIERPASIIAKPDLMHCKTVDSSPSYRLVPKAWQNQPCSGRDQLAWEVLNDEYVSHPIWASEDDGFVASKKSQYEEAMHRCEEERYDYNLNIEANLNTIALLEPIEKKLESMALEEKQNFRLKPGLGGQSVSIYERIIKKVYDRERGMEIIELLYSNPAQVVPVLLNRLKQKDEEWKKAQREWNKIWRELDAKNFYRSLDYQGITFKSNDRKAIAVKALVAEIETMHRDKQTKDGDHLTLKANHQFIFTMKDESIFKDVTRLIFSYIDRQSGFTSSDKEKIRTFIGSFIPLCFHVDNVVAENLRNYADEADDEDMADEEEDAQSTVTEESESDMGRSPSTRRQRRNNQEDDHTMDLLRDVLTKNQSALDETAVLLSRKRSKSPSAPTEGIVDTGEDKAVKTEDMADVDIQMLESQDQPQSREASPVAEKKPAETEGDKLLAAAAAATAPGFRKRTMYSFFCNTTFYCFFRLYQMIYERLSKMKQLDAEASAQGKLGKKTNKVALELGLYSTRFDDIDLSKGYYQALLDLIDRFFDGEMDQQVFEENARYLFVTDAYVLFTVDKLIHAIIKQIQAVTVDTKSVELVRLFRTDQLLENMSPRVMSVYRLRAEDTVGPDENLYKINFDIEAKAMSIQLLDKDDYMLEPSAEDRYEDYVANYMDWVHTTEGIDVSAMRPTFLRRNRCPQDDHLNQIFVQSRLQYKICQDTYHMYYIVGSEDIFLRPHASSTLSEASKPGGEPAPSSAWRNWLESSTTGWSKGVDDDTRRTMETEAKKQLQLLGESSSLA
ncbi:uncharacterized protein BYT42DRAFT_329822 [Radiomyces spectabilis]|uniref:uncharacterized protein n=1 Tax=Radiomyces spectabilis TaxID=64574 RepID=UPI00221F472E|nr:uncharacterized protein BYT42DRAFT_329822 [Radiomyces spectabilis]KAI8379519.1 hypothetical protein BYT42DRAFT_329822 [Radiomyces spectabilis]